MKKLVKLAVVIMVIMATVSCNNKKATKKEPIKVDNQEQLQKESKNFSINSEPIYVSKNVFFKNLLKGVDLSLYEGSTTYLKVLGGQNVSYAKPNGEVYSGKLEDNIFAVQEGNKLLVNGGYLENWRNLDVVNKTFSVILFPKILLTEFTMRFAEKYEGSYFPMDGDETSEFLEDLEFAANDLDSWGYRIDEIKVCDEGFGVMFSDGGVLFFDKNGNLKDDRIISMQKRGETYTQNNFVLLPREQH